MPRPARTLSARPGASAPAHCSPTDARALPQLYALRLHTALPQPGSAAGGPGLRGEVEHVLSGARCSFSGVAELVAWLQARQATAARAAADQVDPPDRPA